MEDQNRGGWSSGNDPTIRALRVGVILSFLALLIWIIIVEDNDLSIAILLVGAIMAAIFPDLGVTIPFIGRKKNDDNE